MRTPSCLAGRHVWYGFAAIILALLMVACGGGRHNQQAALPLEQAPMGIATPATPQTPGTLAEALAQLDALAMPEGVSPQVWNDLKAKLREGLNDRFGGKGAAKIAAKAPTGEENKVWWIYTEGGTEYVPRKLVWRYQNSGDFDLNGVVGVSDIVPFTQAFGAKVSEKPDYYTLDLNRNGLIDIADITGIARNFGNECYSYRIYVRDGVDNLTDIGGKARTSGRHEAGTLQFEFELPSLMNFRPIPKLLVYPQDSSEGLGEPSYIYYGATREDLGTRLASIPIVVGSPGENSATALARWEFPAEMGRNAAMGASTVIWLAQPGHYEFFMISSGDEYSIRHNYEVDIVTQDSLPSIRLYSLGTPTGPLLYWSRDGFADMPVTLEVWRDGEKLTDLSHYSWHYMDKTAGLEQHTYQLRAKYGSFTASSSSPLQTGGQNYIGEHLFLLAEPTRLNGDAKSQVAALLVNTKYKLAAIPTLRFTIEGAPAAVSSFKPAVMLRVNKSSTQAESELQFYSYWLPVYQTGSTAFEIAAVPRSYWMNWEEIEAPAPDTLPPGSTLLFGHFYLETSILAGASSLQPWMNQGGSYSFYIDEFRNMHSFENVHSFDLTTNATGQAVQASPISGQLSLGRPPLPGDFNGDGIVWMDDTSAFIIYFQMAGGNPVTPETESADMNGDGYITFIDFFYFFGYIGQHVS